MPHAFFPNVGSIASCNVLAASAETTVQAAGELMRQRDLSSLVFEVDGQPRIFSIEHLLRFTQERLSPTIRLGELPISNALTIQASDQVLDALALLEDSGDRYLCVLGETDHELGILTYSDLLRAIDPALLVDRKTIGDILSRREAITFAPDWILEDVLCHLTDVESSIIVVENGTPVGIVTARDAFRAITAGDPTDQPLSRYMSQPVVTLPPTASISDALLHLKGRHIKRAIVTAPSGRILGVVTQRELVRFTYGYWMMLLKSHARELQELVGILSARAASFEKESLTDPLTGLGNRRLFKQRIGEEMGRLQRYDPIPFSVLLLDIDHFKHYNDSCGHNVGDEILKSVARAISRGIRDIDIAFRWGGDEFAVLAPHTRIEAASQLAERLKHLVALEQHAGLAGVTISIGVATYISTESERSFFDRFDAALYEAKQNGRNRIEIARVQ